jgi:hypothetical protein
MVGGVNEYQSGEEIKEAASTKCSNAEPNKGRTLDRDEIREIRN